MLRIVGHIESLLLRNDCVIIPRFGGFVLREVPASFEETGALFCPPHKEISFNTNLRHTDGLLAESYMQVYDVDYGNASEMLERDVEALEKCLREEKCLDCGKIGSFRLGDEGQLIFTPGESALWNASFYGLETYHFPKLAPLPAEKPEMWVEMRKPEKDVIYIPVNRRLLRVVAGAAAACALFFLVSTPVKEVNPAAYTASFVPREMMAVSMMRTDAPKEETVDLAKAETTGELKDEPMMEEPKEAVPEAKPVEKAEVAKAPEVKTAPAVRQKMFHIVIASFPNEQQADEYISTVDRQVCTGVDKIMRDGKCRVYAARFDNREEAERYQVALRKHEKYKDAWLFISR